jgi:5-methylcytosine-specific restriction endonuclease McrA
LIGVSIERVIDYVRGAPTDPLSRWQSGALLASANIPPPEDLLRRHDKVMRADTYALWFRWFIEGFCNPLRYVQDETKTIVDVLADTLSRVNAFYASEPERERTSLAEVIATHVMREVTRQRHIARINASTAQRRDLIESVAIPRCWMCGYAFSAAAISRFLKAKPAISLKQPEFVDIFRPRGLYLRDVSIEVEHIVPVASGGGGSGNLALACGWCNKVKGARTGLYDASATAPRVGFAIGAQDWHELPHPFWTVRLVATRRVCESVTACTADVTTAEMFIAPSDHRGSPNPSNLHVYCAAHDPYADVRYFGREAARKIWLARR